MISASPVLRSAGLAPFALILPLLVGPGCKPDPGLPEETRSNPEASATDSEATGYPPTAKPTIHASLLADSRAPRHPSDGGGRAVLIEDPNQPPITYARSRRRFEFRFDVGPLGIAEGGVITLQVPPFWGWSSPQTISPIQPGYTTVRGPAGVDLNAAQLDQQLLGIEVSGRPLVAGESLSIVYGDSLAPDDPRGLAQVDRYAEDASTFHFGVDGDGDGVRELCQNGPSIQIAAGPATQLVATLESTARPGEQVRLSLAALDAFGSLGDQFAGVVRLRSEPPGWEIPGSVSFESDQPSAHTLRLPAPDQGTWRILAEAFAPGADEPFATTRSNPLRVSAAPHLLWIDLHGHSALSDGTGTPEQFFTYAREVAQLDAVALTDHDAWGLPFLSKHPELVASIDRAAREASRPGEFLGLAGFEWTSWIYGHRHVVYFDGPLEIHSSLAETSDTPAKLQAILKTREALIIPHHPAGGPIAIDWDFIPDPRLTPLVEVCSVHGSSDAATDPERIYSSVPGHFVRDALRAGHRYGLIGSGDSHDGHPGLPQLAAQTGGLAAVMCEELTPSALLEALRARRTYATSGERIVLRANLAGSPMGSDVPASLVRDHAGLYLEIIGTQPLVRLELIGPEGILSSEPLGGLLEFRGAFEVPPLEVGTWLYVRVEQADRSQAWSSPFWVVEG